MALIFCSFAVDTSFMALVICCVPLILRIRSWISRVVAIYSTTPVKSCLKRLIASFSRVSISGVKT